MSVHLYIWIIITLSLCISVVLIDTDPHTKFQVATVMGTLQSIYVLQISEHCKISLSSKSVNYDILLIVLALSLVYLDPKELSGQLSLYLPSDFSIVQKGAQDIHAAHSPLTKNIQLL